MRRTISLVASFGLLLGMAIPASAAVEAGPRCADIDTLLWNYDGTDGETNADDVDEFGLRLMAPSCSRYTYTVYVFADSTSTSPLATFEWQGDGTTQVFQAFRQVTSTEDPDGTLYIYGESWFENGGGGRIVHDRAPDSGFAVATIDGPTPGTTQRYG